MKFVNKNYYEILDIDPTATDEDVKRAYRLVRGTWKPDSIAIYSLYTPDECEAIGHKIEEAFQILSSPERRASYDRYLKFANRVPETVTEPTGFWDFVHGVEIPAHDQDLLEDVTDLLAEGGIELEEIEEDVVLEATGGDARGFERVVSEETAGYEPHEAIPDHSAGERRSGTRPPAFHSAGAPAHPRPTASTQPRASAGTASSRPAAPAPRETRLAVPAAPAAPPVKGAPPAWTPPPETARAPSRPESVRTSGSSPRPETSRPQSSSRPEASRPQASSRPDPTRPASSSRPEPSRATSETGRPESRDSRESWERESRAPSSVRAPMPTPASEPRPAAGDGGWSRSYAAALKPSRSLPDRPLSPQMLADAEAEFGLGGAFLRAVREYKGVTLQDISERTKIQSTYLRYVEDENYEGLPPAVYVEGFVQQMARLLKLDVHKVVTGYMARYHRPPETQGPDEL